MGPSTLPRLSSSEARATLALAQEAVRQLAVLIRNAYLHDPDNEVFVEPTQRLRATLDHLLRAENAFDLEVVGSELFANQLRLRLEIRNLQVYRYVASELARRRLGGLRFAALPERGALSRFLAALLKLPARSEGDASAELNATLDREGVGEIDALPLRHATTPPPGDRRQRAIETYQQTLDFIRECMTTLDSPAEINLRRAKRHIQRLVDLSYEEGEGFSLAGLAAIKSHNEYTFNHMVNVCVLSIAFGSRLGLDRGRLAQLGLCALYHDMGKLDIPLEILEKHGPLSREEWAVMGNHTVFGARALFAASSRDPMAATRALASLQHHKGVDGSGYPALRLLRRQNLFVRIVAIADAFDAMTNKRVYQRKFLPDEALAALLAEGGTRYDPVLLKAFVNCMGLFPVGSLVLLATGETAVVVESNPDPACLNRPKLRLVTDSKRVGVENALVDLGDEGQEHRKIVRCLDPDELGVDPASYAV